MKRFKLLALSSSALIAAASPVARMNTLIIQGVRIMNMKMNLLPAKLLYLGRTLAGLALAVALGIGTSSAASITYVGKISGYTDFSPSGLDIGQAGFWFPRFGLQSLDSGPARTGPFTASLPSWITFDYGIGSTRTFSLDAGGVQSVGGNSSFATVTLPNGATGLSGTTSDPQTANNNSNNSINRISLGNGTPSTFYFSILTDNTNGLYDPKGRLRARGNDSGTDIEADTFPHSVNNPVFEFDGSPDLFVFRYDDFGSGDFIKLQLANGVSIGGNGAGFGGLLFDTSNPLDNVPVVPEPVSTALLAIGAAIGLMRIRRRG